LKKAGTLHQNILKRHSFVNGNKKILKQVLKALKQLTAIALSSFVVQIQSVIYNHTAG